MTHLVINNRKYPLPEQWFDLSIAQGEWYDRQVHNLNYRLRCEQTFSPHASSIKRLERFGTNLLIRLCEVPPKIALQTIPEERSRFATEFISHLKFPSSHNSYPAASFIWENERLYYPTNGKALDGSSLPMRAITAGEFCSASDLFCSDSRRHTALIVAILCRPCGESYQEKQALERADRLRRLPLKYAWPLIETLQETHRILRKWFPYCYASPRKHSFSHTPEKPYSFENAKQTTSWDDLILEAAAYRPESLHAVEAMNLYDFMRILNGKFKRAAQINGR